MSTYANFWVAYEATLDLEVIQENNKPVKPVTLAAVTHDMSRLTLKDIEAVKAI